MSNNSSSIQSSSAAAGMAVLKSTDIIDLTDDGKEVIDLTGDTETQKTTGRVTWCLAVDVGLRHVGWALMAQINGVCHVLEADVEELVNQDDEGRSLDVWASRIKPFVQRQERLLYGFGHGSHANATVVIEAQALFTVGRILPHSARMSIMEGMMHAAFTRSTVMRPQEVSGALGLSRSAGGGESAGSRHKHKKAKAVHKVQELQDTKRVVLSSAAKEKVDNAAKKDDIADAICIGYVFLEREQRRSG